jgi:hypothetical protein
VYPEVAAMNSNEETVNMAIKYRITFELYDDETPQKALKNKTILDEILEKPRNSLNYGMGLQKQIQLIQKTQDFVLSEKNNLFLNRQETCPKCQIKLRKFGTSRSLFFDVYSEHTVSIQRIRCAKCNYEPPKSLKEILGTNVSADLKKIQATLGAQHTYRESEHVFTLFSGRKRRINNHDRIKHVTESVGQASQILDKEEKEMMTCGPAQELILTVDGGHINTTEEKRSLEVMTSVIYKPDAIKKNPCDTRNIITSKSCAASVRDDSQAQIVSNTIVAALKQGLGEKTHVTALADGAANCWAVIDAIKPLCGRLTSILDWFHIAMKIENISLPKRLKEKLIRIKWLLWRGKVDTALLRLAKLKELSKKDKSVEKLRKFSDYILNNQERLVDYSLRKKKGLVFTSNLAESTVESLINQRCKGQQHMRWSREGLNPVLQLRAAIHSQDWSHKWKDAVLNAA